MSLDMTDGRDRRDLAAGLARGWPLEHDDLARYKKALDWALSEAVRQGRVREAASCVRTLVSIVGQVQADEHLDRKYAEAEAGNAESVQRIVVEYGDDQAE